MDKALVTGGAGFIGSNLVEAIADRYEVTVLDNFHTGDRKNLEKVYGDIKIIDQSCNRCLELDLMPDVIYHLGIPSSSPMYKKNPFLVGEAINGMIAIMELAKRVNSRKVILASSSSLYNGVPFPHIEDAAIPAMDYYTEARLAIERIAELYHVLFGINYAAMRFFSVYGPHEESKGHYANMVTQFLWSMKANESPIIYGDGSQTRDFIYVKDVVNALILASEKGYGVFNVGTGDAHTFSNVVDLLNQELGKEIVPTYKENPIRNYVMHTKADTSKIENLGFKAKYSLRDGISKINMYYS